MKDNINNAWNIVFNGFNPKEEGVREALCTLGNGYFAMRGAAIEMPPDDIHYPGTYIAGVYNDLESLVLNKIFHHESLVNFPQGLRLTFRIKGSDWFSFKKVKLLQYQQVLNLRRGTLKRILRFVDRKGRKTRINYEWFVDMSNPHMARLIYYIIPENWSGYIEILSELNGDIRNKGVLRYQTLNDAHLNIKKMGLKKECSLAFLTLETKNSQIYTTFASRISIFINKKSVNIKHSINKNKYSIKQKYRLLAEKMNTITIEKTLSLCTSKDLAIQNTQNKAQSLLLNIDNFNEKLQAHCDVWEKLWHRCDLKIENNALEQKYLRFNIFHLLQSASWHSMSKDCGIGARGLHGEAYRGHIFWDELFILPFYTYRLPEVTRALLLYRYYRLPMARVLAQKINCQGALFPWQSGSDGIEQSQLLHLNPLSQIWDEDYSHHQRHINHAIVYNVWHYYLVTHDVAFLQHYGAELILDIAHFWSSYAQYDFNTQRYEINHIMGPDEFHECYPKSKELGLKNNAYTNIMAVWVFDIAFEILSLLSPLRKNELMAKLKLKESDFSRWQDIQRKIKIPFSKDGMLEQFEGYDQLEDLPLRNYRKKYALIERMDRILKSEGDTPDRYKISKQPDVVMLFYLLPEKIIQNICSHAGYELPKTEKIISYYYQRTTHGSTLSHIVFGAVLHKFDFKKSRSEYLKALRSDIENGRQMTTAEGIHLGVMAGTVNFHFYQHAGIEPLAHILTLNPNLASAIRRLEFRLQFHSHWYHITITQTDICVVLEEEQGPSVSICIYGQTFSLFPGHEFCQKLRGLSL